FPPRLSRCSQCDSRTLRAANQITEGLLNLTWNALEHLSVRREFFHEHQQSLNRFLRLVSSQTAANEIDFLQFPRLQQQLFPSCAREKNIHRRINPLVADFPVEHHLHVSGAFEFLKH